jgi:hypothetical protein
MGAVWPVLLLGLAGILLGGAVSLRRQGAGPVPVGVVGLLALLAGAGGILWLVPSA